MDSLSKLSISQQQILAEFEQEADRIIDESERSLLKKFNELQRELNRIDNNLRQSHYEGARDGQHPTPDNL